MRETTLEAAEILSQQFLAFVDVISKLYPAMLEKTGLTRVRWGILYLAREHAPLTMSELTRLTELPKSNMTYHVDWLEAGGYLKREPSAEDRRVTHLTVLPEGAALVQRVPDELKRRMARLAEQVSPAELQAIETGLTLLVARSGLLFDD